jgi:hypothetical protein
MLTPQLPVPWYCRTPTRQAISASMAAATGVAPGSQLSALEEAQEEE